MRSSSSSALTGSARADGSGPFGPDPTALHPIVANWLADPRLHAFKDDFGRSARRHGSDAQTSGGPLTDFAAKLRLLEELRGSSPRFFEDHDYAWALRPESYLVPSGGDPKTADQTLRHPLTVLRTLVGVW